MSRRKDGRRMTEKEISTKRRATMNSRRTDEEDEMLRRAIEESKGEAGTLGKRPRDDSEEYDSPIDTPPTSRPTDYSSSNKHGSKRQRTLSSSSTLSKQSRSPSQLLGEEVSTKPSTNGNIGVKKIRGAAAARNHRDKEVRDRQKEIAAQRAEAARKREARSERRRGEGKTGL